MTYVFVVSVCPDYGMPRISQEAYTSLAKAQAFIESRGDHPERIDAFHYKGLMYGYTIRELSLR